MEGCAKCGRTAPVADRFCGGCGSPLATEADESGAGRIGSIAPGLDVGDAGADVLLEGTAVNQAVRSESEVRSSAQLRWVLLGVASLVVLVVGLSQWPKGESPPNRDSDTAAKESDELEEDGGEETASPTSIEDAPDEEETGTTRASNNGEDGTTKTGKTTDADADDGTASSGPVLGVEMGLGLVLSRPGSGQVSLLDLDTGLVHELEARGEPIGVIDGTVVLRRNDSVTLLNLDSIAAEAIPLPESSDGWTQVVSINQDRVWVFETGPNEIADEWTVAAYNGAGERVDEATFLPQMSPAGWDPNADLIQTTGGGVYRRQGDSFNRLSTGNLLVAGERLVLIRECDDKMDCAQNWYDSETWERRSFPEPSVPVQGRIFLQNDDRWLYAMNWINGQGTLHEVATGKEIELGDRFGHFGEMIQAPISPDGRWLFQAGEPAMRFLDLDTETEWTYDNAGHVADVVGVFVELDDVEFLP